jgi:hypothetical protein
MLLQEVVASGWESLITNVIASSDQLASRLRTALEELESKDDEAAIAQEACFGALVLLELLSDPRPEQAIRIMNFLRDIVDLRVSLDFHLDPNAEDFESQILASELMRNEHDSLEGALETITSHPLDEQLVRSFRR